MKGRKAGALTPPDGASDWVIVSCRNVRASSERVRRDTQALLSKTADVRKEHDALKRQTVYKLIALSEIMTECVQQTLRYRLLRGGRIARERVHGRIGRR